MLSTVMVLCHAHWKNKLQGLHNSSYTIKFHKLPLEGDRGLHLGSCTLTHTNTFTKEGRLGSPLAHAGGVEA